MTRHDVTDPDPLCYGDDPCVCEQLIEARRQTIQACIESIWDYEWRTSKLHQFDPDQQVTFHLLVAASRLRSIRVKA